MAFTVVPSPNWHTRYVTTTNGKLLHPLSLAMRDDMERYRNDSVRTQNVGQSSEERELKQMRYEEDDDDDMYYDDDEPDSKSSRSRSKPDPYYENDIDDDDDNDDEWEEDEQDGSVGNFWNNPLGGMDKKFAVAKGKSRRSRSPGPMEQPSPPRRRERGSQRKTFRSGNPPPPGIMKDLYDKIFWFGFDPDDTTTAADRTMFGGTKGKFNGMGLLEDIAQDSLPDRDNSRRDRNVGRKLPNVRNDEYEYEDEDDDFDDDVDDDFDDDVDAWEDIEEYIVEPVPVRKTENMKKSGRGRERTSSSLPQTSSSREEYNQDEFITEDFEDVERAQSSPKRRPRQSPTDRRTRSNLKERRSTFAAWFDDENRSEMSQNRSTKRRRNNMADEEEDKGDSQTSPIINMLDTIFQVDPDEVKYQAEDYDRRLGLGKKKRTRTLKEDRIRSSTPRKGYTYRYNKENDGADFTKSTMQQEECNIPSAKRSDSDFIDVEATVQADAPKYAKVRERKPKEQSWEDRAASYERVPPRGILAWGPDGVIDESIDARTYAARCAIEEIEKARARYEKKEQTVTEAERDLLQLKREASIQKKLLLSQNDRRKLSLNRDRLRMINFDIEDSARQLRMAKGETLAAIDKLEDIELRHWALLRQFEADNEMIPTKRSSSEMK